MNSKVWVTMLAYKYILDKNEGVLEEIVQDVEII